MKPEPKVRIAIFVSGGNVQDVVSDRDDVELVLIDYDNEESTGKRDRKIVSVRHDDQFLERAMVGTEDDYCIR